MTKYIDEHFFDKESKRRDYVLGAFYACYVPQPKGGILFRNRNKDLVEIIKRELKSEHAIIADNRKRDSYWIEVYRVPIMYSRLGELGLNKPKEEREFPRVNEKYISHFVRGFFDAKARIWTEYNKYKSIHILFNNLFLLDLHKMLVKYAKIQGHEPKEDYTKYNHNDSIKIRDFIYQDWNFIKQSGLYLPSKKELLETDYIADYNSNPRIINAKKKVEKAKKLLDRKKVGEVAKELGYAHHISFTSTFKKITGMSPFEYKAGCKWFERKKLQKTSLNL